MRSLSRIVLLVAATATLVACAGYQKGRGLNAFDSKSFWYSGYDGGAAGDDGANETSSDATSGAGSSGSDNASQ